MADKKQPPPLPSKLPGETRTGGGWQKPTKPPSGDKRPAGLPPKKK